MRSSATQQGTRKILHHDEHVMGTIVTFDLYDDEPPSTTLWNLLHEAIDVLHQATTSSARTKRTARSPDCDEASSPSSSAPKLSRSAELCRVARTITGGWLTRGPFRRRGPYGYVKGWAAQRSLDVLRRSGIRALW